MPEKTHLNVKKVEIGFRNDPDGTLYMHVHGLELNTTDPFTKDCLENAIAPTLITALIAIATKTDPNKLVVMRDKNSMS